jgi:hypothetical protein
MALTSRNRELQVLLRETESRISQVTGALAEKSAKMDALVSEVNLLKSEKTITKVGQRHADPAPHLLRCVAEPGGPSRARTQDSRRRTCPT